MTVPRASSSHYFVHGVALVNCGEELCEACGVRKAVGASIAGHLLCPRCAGWAAHEAEELAKEKEASAARRGVRRLAARPPKFTCGHDRTPDNTYRNPTNGRARCRECARRHVRESHARTRGRVS